MSEPLSIEINEHLVTIHLGFNSTKKFYALSQLFWDRYVTIYTKDKATPCLNINQISVCPKTEQDDKQETKTDPPRQIITSSSPANYFIPGTTSKRPIQPGKHILNLGDNTTLHCWLFGAPPGEILLRQWKHFNMADEKILIHRVNADLTITNFSVKDIGTYTCMANDVERKLKEEFKLYDPPVITSVPKDDVYNSSVDVMLTWTFTRYAAYDDLEVLLDGKIRSINSKAVSVHVDYNTGVALLRRMVLNITLAPKAALSVEIRFSNVTIVNHTFTARNAQSLLFGFITIAVFFFIAGFLLSFGVQKLCSLINKRIKAQNQDDHGNNL